MASHFPCRQSTKWLELGKQITRFLCRLLYKRRYFLKGENVKEWFMAIVVISFDVVLQVGLSRKQRVPKRFLRDPGFPLFEARNSGLKHKIDARFGIESMPVRWDAKNNHRHCGIARKFWSGFPTGWKNLLRTLKANI